MAILMMLQVCVVEYYKPTNLLLRLSKPNAGFIRIVGIYSKRLILVSG